MGVKSSIAKLAASVIATQIYREHRNAEKLQQRIFERLIDTAKHTRFGTEHEFTGVRSHRDFTHAVPVKDYEDIRHYIEMIAEGKPGVLWPGLPLYFCKSSGTTSGVKYIPLTKEAVMEQIRAARNALLIYVHETGHASFFDHKMIFLQGSPELHPHGEIPSGRLSGIVYNHVPAYLNKNRMPSYRVNCIDDWEEKVDAIAKETLPQNMSLISGIPPWVIMYFEKLLAISGKNSIAEIFPDFELFVYGGVNYEPYRQKVERLIGRSIPTLETYPASEGFLAFQDSQKSNGLLLNLNGGIFYEFIKAEEISKDGAKRYTIGEVELNLNYAVILNTNAGLWAYSLGDTVKFISKNPYRILVTGRVKHFISAFGEHVIAEEVEFALLNAAQKTGAQISEFTVAPKVEVSGELPYHEWFVEFSKAPENIVALASETDRLLQQKNIYYRDLRAGNILQQLKIRALREGTFVSYMRSAGKLGGQNKVARLTNDRQIATALEKLI